MAESYKKYMTFVTLAGTYQFQVILFRLINAVSKFQRMMVAMLKNISFTQAYLDDVVVHSKTMDEHMAHSQKLFVMISGLQMQLKTCKCEFAKNKVDLFGHIVISDSVAADPKNVVAIRNSPASFYQTSLQSFFVIAGYYQRFIKKVAVISALPYAATSKTASFYWNQRVKDAFD